MNLIDPARLRRLTASAARSTAFAMSMRPRLRGRSRLGLLAGQVGGTVLFTMRRWRRALAIWTVPPALAGLLAGCMLNAVRPVPPGSAVMPDGPVVIYGVGMEGTWPYPRFGVELAHYDVKAQRATGNCFVFHRTHASIPSTPGPVSYFAFEVPAGHYVYSAHNGATLSGQPVAFSAAEGRAVYLGDFVHTPSGSVEWRRNAEALERVLPVQFPGTRGHLAWADAVAVQPPKAFLCAP